MLTLSFVGHDPQETLRAITGGVGWARRPRRSDDGTASTPPRRRDRPDRRARPRGKGRPQIGALIETPGPLLPTLRLLRWSFRCRPRRAARAHARIYGGLNLLIPHRARPEFGDADLCKKNSLERESIRWNSLSLQMGAWCTRLCEGEDDVQAEYWAQGAGGRDGLRP